VVTDTDRRGAQLFAADLHDALARSGRDVRTVALAPGAVGGLDLPILAERRLSARSLRVLRKEISRASVVIAHGSSTLPACAMATVGTRVPFVYRQISDSLFWANSAARRARVRLGLARTDAVVALWPGSARILTDVFGVRTGKIWVIPNGVRTDRFLPSDAGARVSCRIGLGLDPALPTVVSVGALAREKGTDLVIDAMADLDGAQLLVVGAGPERDALQHLADKRAPGRVTFAGSLPDARPAYCAADVVVLASRGGDSMPATLIEASMMGIPTVSTPVEGIPEIIVDGVTGALVPIDDSRALCGALRSLLGDAERARALGAAASEHCHRLFAIDEVARQWMTVLESVER
jgi:glycosyltransferase involved in cell wall biosynthesis